MATTRRIDSYEGYQKNHGMPSRITDEDDKRLYNKAHITQHKKYDTQAMKESASAQQFTKTEKKRMVMPVEETTEVPVYRQVLEKGTKTVVVTGRKYVPTTKYKKVEETSIQTVTEMVDGVPEKRAVPVTKVREIPYTDYVEQIVEIPVEVPDDRVKQQLGTRADKHIVSKVVEVEEDHVYVMKPVLVSKGEKRMKHLGEHNKYKTKHGAPSWEQQHDDWQKRPITPEYRDDLHRPMSSKTIRSSATSIVVPRPKTGFYHAGKVPGGSQSSPTLGMGKSLGSTR